MIININFIARLSTYWMNLTGKLIQLFKKCFTKPLDGALLRGVSLTTDKHFRIATYNWGKVHINLILNNIMCSSLLTFRASHLLCKFHVYNNNYIQLHVHAGVSSQKEPPLPFFGGRYGYGYFYCLTYRDDIVLL